MRNSKILATIGPVSESGEMIEQLVRAGANAFRLNFSHDSHENHSKRIGHIRALEKKMGMHISIVADLQGAKLRVGEVSGDAVPVVAGESFEFRLADGPGDEQGVSLPHPEIFSVAEEGMDILVEDGLLRFRVTGVSDTVLTTTVVVGGKMKSRKGVNVPTVELPISALTEKDLQDLEFALSQGVDWVALSFVQRPEDVAQAKEIIAGRAGVIAKIEKPSAVSCIDAIIDQSDAIMVARGDLGVEMPPEKVPMVQKEIIKKCRVDGTLVIVATQMLDSMMRSPVPTRAEVSDVTNALYDGTDVVMLSGETAAGDYPVESVVMMRDILKQTESSDMFMRVASGIDLGVPETKTGTIALSAYRVSRQLNLKAIVVFSDSGNTARCCARHRPVCPLLCLTPNVDVARRLSLLWGVGNIYIRAVFKFDEVVKEAVRVVLEHGFAEKGDTIVVTAGAPFESGEGENEHHEYYYCLKCVYFVGCLFFVL